jgi:hypothetical protein
VNATNAIRVPKPDEPISTEQRDLIRAAVHAGHIDQVVIFCDTCLIRFESDFIGATAEDRFAAARAYLATEHGWSGADSYDGCPDHPACQRCKAAAAVGDCCGSHHKRLCHRCYRVTHFVAMCGCNLCAAENLPEIMDGRDAERAACAWNAAHPDLHRTLLRFRTSTEPGARWRDGTPMTGAYLLDGVPTVRILAFDSDDSPNYDAPFVALTDIVDHPAAARYAQLATAIADDLDFPPPYCPQCAVALISDGERWDCLQCAASWPIDGGRGTRTCTECAINPADVLGLDQQPRCAGCQARVLAGHLEATAPYPCRDCGTQVVGIGPNHASGAALDRRCGECNHFNREAAS